MNEKNIAGIIIGGSIGGVVGLFASIYVNNVLYNGAPHELEKVAFIIPIGTGAYLGYLASK
jgi:hypothetical protein